MSHKISLVVDDESAVRTYIKAVLQSGGFQTLEALDGHQALEIIRKLGTGVDLLVSDIQMPKLDGLTLAHLVRTEFPEIPVILVSAYAEVEQASHPELKVEFIQKPFVPAILLKAVKNVIDSRQSGSRPDAV